MAYRRGFFVFFLLLALVADGYSQQQPTIEHVPAPNVDPTSGVQMYHAYCAVCHALDGKGDGPAAPALKRQPPDLTLLAKKNGGQFPTFRVSNIIMGEGDTIIPAHGSRDMPMWGDIFSDIQRNDAIIKLRVHNLTEYLASIQQK
jgi:mono/diheme cytochrome c family protein